MTVIILVSLISATLLLITVLLIILKLVVKKFKKKLLVTPERNALSRLHAGSRQPQIIHTQLDPETPYAVDAPPSYRDTMLADIRVESSAAVVPAEEDEESSLLTQDVLASNDHDITSSHTPQPV